MNRKERYDELERILPLAWNSYQHMYDVRATNTSNRINFLLIIVSFLPIACITLFTELNKSVFLLPIIPQIIAFTILLKVFFIKPPEIHWFNMVKYQIKEIVLDDMKNKEFNKKLLSELKALEDDTWLYLREMRGMLKISSYLIVFSLYLIVSISIFLYFESNLMLYISNLFLITFLLWLCLYYHKQPKYDFSNNYQKYQKQIEDWLNKK